MARVRAHIDAGEVFRTLAEVGQPGLNDTMAEFLTKVGERIRKNAAERQIIRSSLGPVHPTRLTSRSGALRRSIAVDLRELPDAISVGSHLFYAPLHELGIPPFPPRPFLAPALEEESILFADAFGRAWDAKIEQA